MCVCVCFEFVLFLCARPEDAIDDIASKVGNSKSYRSISMPNITRLNSGDRPNLKTKIINIRTKQIL